MPRPPPDIVDEQVHRLDHPVRQRLRRELDTFTGGVVVVGESGSRRVRAQRALQVAREMRGGEGHGG